VLRTDILSLTQPGKAHSVDLMWETDGGKLECWYVHLQEPLRRTQVGFDTMDQLLDIVINPDKSRWRWKDDDEFVEAVEMGVFTREEETAIRAEGERVIETLESNQPPFCDGWDNWTPPDDWGIAEFPPGWDQVE
jgi:predicted RNA-binding protein associated with RNAse of E/G family